ncbi:hypothetical protein C6N75_09835 [Streptomyces solincola]|uniref:Uncharacterized protein n=1 Tax=Streptomyces solincola TaxID=2100817 RepID=A0A2S9PY87_9ACTN|nr:hypothetical protein [Streptomyces solincola]PRH79375.1 hypothetical protein C6N75_09835 [Streptomyces solincola]
MTDLDEQQQLEEARASLQQLREEEAVAVRAMEEARDHLAEVQARRREAWERVKGLELEQAHNA